MKAHEIKANEEFCDHLLDVIRDNGKWGWPDQQVVFTVRSRKFMGNAAALDRAQRIVSPEYFSKHFEILKED
jgi:hypothetical protein